MRTRGRVSIAITTRRTTPYKHVDPDGRNPKLIVDFALNVALNLVTTGELGLMSAAKDTALGALNPVKTIQTAGRLIGALSKGSAGAAKLVAHPSQRAARRAAEREAGMGKHGAREALPDQKPHPGSQSPQGDPGVRTEARSTDTGNIVHHDASGHRDGNIPPHYGVDSPGKPTTHHTYPSDHDPSTNR